MAHSRDLPDSDLGNGAAPEKTFMRQLLLLSLSVGAVLGIALAACSGGGSLQPIAEIRDRASGQAGGDSSSGGTEQIAGSAGSVQSLAGTSGAAGTGAATEQGGYSGIAGSTSSSGGGTTSTAGTTSSGGTSTGGSTGGTGGLNTGGTDIAGGCSIFPDINGRVPPESNECQIRGFWFSYSDCSASLTGDCTQSLVPAEGAPFVNENGLMCTSGTTAIINDATEVDTKWGAGIGLSLNQLAGVGTPRETIAGLPYPLTAFRFTISGTTVPEEIRVNFPTPTTERIEHFATVVGAGEFTVYLSDVAQGDWVVTPTPLDSSQVTAIQFQVAAKFNEAVVFDYCVNNLQALF